MALGQTTARSESLEEDSQECLMFPTPGCVHIRGNVGGRTVTAQLNIGQMRQRLGVEIEKQRNLK